MRINPYLTFPGTCAEAFATYAEALGGRVTFLQTHGESPMADSFQPEWRDKVMHAELQVAGWALYGSDAPPQWYEKPQGLSVSLNLTEIDEARRVFAALSQGGEVRMEFQATFWAEGFGMLTDRFGIPWMLNVQAEASA